MATIQKQVRMVFDLNKCIGCQACTMACKTMCTDRNQGQMYQYWNSVESRPGRGYPKNWETLGGGFSGNQVDLGADPHVCITTSIEKDYGSPWEYNDSEVMKAEGGDATSTLLAPSPAPDGPDAYASNWDEDRGENDMPNNYYFYLPRICNHCSKPACAAPVRARRSTNARRTVSCSGTLSPMMLAKDQIIRLIKDACKIPVVRDVYYNALKVHSDNVIGRIPYLNSLPFYSEFEKGAFKVLPVVPRRMGIPPPTASSRRGSTP